MRILVFFLGIIVWQYFGLLGALMIGVPYVWYEIYKTKREL